jgi:imidazolonepropionase
MRLAGRTQAEIAQAGGGIVSTVKATRAAGEADLVTLAAGRALALMADGVTTVEVKSGYGLDTANEAKQLRAARALPAALSGRLDVVTTFLGAHALAAGGQRRQGPLHRPRDA